MCRFKQWRSFLSLADVDAVSNVLSEMYITQMSTKDARKIRRISFTSPFQQTTRSYQMNSMLTIRPAEPESPEIPDTQPQQPQITPPETLPSITTGPTA